MFGVTLIIFNTLSLPFDLWLAWGKVDFQNCSRWAFLNAFAAKLALVVIDVGKIVFKGDGLVGANLDAFATANTSHLASLTGWATFILVDTRYIDTLTFWTFLAKFNDKLRASLDASTASRTLFLINNR